MSAKSWSSVWIVSCLLSAACGDGAANHDDKPDDKREFSGLPHTQLEADPTRVVPVFEAANLSDGDTLADLDSAEKLALCGENDARLAAMFAARPERSCKVAAMLSEAFVEDSCEDTLDSCVDELTKGSGTPVEDDEAEENEVDASCDLPSCSGTVAEYRACQVALTAFQASALDAYSCGDQPATQPSLPPECKAIDEACPEMFED